MRTAVPSFWASFMLATVVVSCWLAPVFGQNNMYLSPVGTDISYACDGNSCNSPTNACRVPNYIPTTAFLGPCNVVFVGDSSFASVGTIVISADASASNTLTLATQATVQPVDSISLTVTTPGMPVIASDFNCENLTLSIVANEFTMQNSIVSFADGMTTKITVSDYYGGVTFNSVQFKSTNPYSSLSPAFKFASPSLSITDSSFNFFKSTFYDTTVPTVTFSTTNFYFRTLGPYANVYINNCFMVGYSGIYFLHDTSSSSLPITLRSENTTWVSIGRIFADYERLSSLSFTGDNFNASSIGMGVTATEKLQIDNVEAYGSSFQVSVGLSTSTIISNSMFTRDSFASIGPLVYLIGLSSRTPATMVNNTFVSTPDDASARYCDVSFLNMDIMPPSNLSVNTLCIGSEIEVNTWLSVRYGIFNTSDYTLLSGYNSSGTGSQYVWSMGPIVYEVPMVTNLTLRYMVDDPNQSISPPLNGPINYFVLPTLVIIELAHARSQPMAGTLYPLASHANISSNALLLGVSDGPSINISYTEPIVYWSTQIIIANPSPAPTGSLSCLQAPPSPASSFSCVNGQWVSVTSIETPVVIVGPSTGPVVINGNLTIETGITFQGLDSSLVINGCLHLPSGAVVTIELTQEQVEALTAGPRTLITLAGNHSCEDSTQLSSVGITVSSPPSCKKVTGTAQPTPSSLGVLLSIDSSACKKSNHIAAIVAPSVIGGVLILSVIGALVWLKVRKDKGLA